MASKRRTRVVPLTGDRAAGRARALPGAALAAVLACAVSGPAHAQPQYAVGLAAYDEAVASRTLTLSKLSPPHRPSANTSE